jgi:hypothetical protein
MNSSQYFDRRNNLPPSVTPPRKREDQRERMPWRKDAALNCCGDGKRRGAEEMGRYGREMGGK